MFASRAINGQPVHPIGLGCMSLSWGYSPFPSEADSVRLLHRALDLGYNHLDTARIYGLGHNERLIGETLAGRRKEFFLASKCGIIVNGDDRRIDCSRQAIRAAVEQSLALLRTDHIDLYYLHRPDPAVPIEESVGELARLVEEGKIGGIGLSEMSATTLRRAVAVHPIAAMQTEYSPWTRNPEIAVLEACRELGVTFVAFSPVGRGALAGAIRDPQDLPKEDLRSSMPRFMPENWPHNRSLIDRFETIAREAGVTPAQLSLAWTLARGQHVVAIPGTSRIDHVEENIARADWEIPAHVSEAVDAVLAQGEIVGSRYNASAQSTVTTEEFA